MPWKKRDNRASDEAKSGTGGISAQGCKRRQVATSRVKIKKTIKKGKRSTTEVWEGVIGANLRGDSNE